MNASRWGIWVLLLSVVAGLGIAMMMRGPGSRLFGERSPSAQVTGQAPAALVSGEQRTLSRLGDYGHTPAFDLIRQDGQRFQDSDLLGKLWVGDFIFTSCASICPLMTRQMQALAQSVPAAYGVEFVSFSVDPERDTPEVFTTYAQEYGIDTTNWHFLTGEKQHLRDLVLRGFHLSVQDASREDLLAGAEAVIHSTRFVVVDGEGVIRGYYDGTDEEAMEQLLADLAVLGDRAAMNAENGRP